MLRILFLSVFFIGISVLAAEKSSESLFTENALCCGDSVNLVLDLNYENKTLQLKQMNRFKDKLCKPRNPEDFGNSLITFTDHKNLIYKAKIQMPLIDFYDFQTHEKPDGAIRKIKNTIYVLKIPGCFDYRSKKVKITDLNGQLLVKGEL